MEIKFVNFKAPSKRFVKVKGTQDIRVVSRIVFEADGMDDETLMLITQMADSGAPVSIDIKAPVFNLW